jgi:hypothetical protein
LQLTTSRETVSEDNEIYAENMKKLMQYAEKEHFDRKPENNIQKPKAEKRIDKMFLDALRLTLTILPETIKPIVWANASGNGVVSSFPGDKFGSCVEQVGILDSDNGADVVVGKPLGNGNGHKRGSHESYFRRKEGNGKILAPSPNMSSLHLENMPEPRVVPLANKEKPIVYYEPVGNRLIINWARPSSEILMDAKPTDPKIKSQVMPLLMRAALDYVPGSSEMSKDDYNKTWETLLDRAYSQ